MCEHHNRRAVGNRLEIIFHPFELLIAELAQATFANRHHVVQADEVRAFVIEAEPALAFRTLAKPFEVLFAVVVEHVVFAGDIKHPRRFAGLENLLERVEFFRFREMGEIAGVKDEVRRGGQCVDLGYRFLQCTHHVLVGFLVEANVTVADLHEREVSGNRGFGFGGDGIGRPQNAGGKRAACACSEHPRAGPGHAFEKAAPVPVHRGCDREG